MDACGPGQHLPYWLKGDCRDGQKEENGPYGDTGLRGNGSRGGGDHFIEHIYGETRGSKGYREQTERRYFHSGEGRGRCLEGRCCGGFCRNWGSEAGGLQGHRSGHGANGGRGTGGHGISAAEDDEGSQRQDSRGRLCLRGL